MGLPALQGPACRDAAASAPLNQLPPTNQILAIANIPLRDRVLVAPAESPLDDRDLTRKHVWRLKAETLLRGLAEGFLETNRQRWTAQPVDLPLANAEGVFYTADGTGYSWACVNDAALAICGPKSVGLLLTRERYEVFEAVLVPDLLVPPKAAQVLAAHPFRDNPVGGPCQIVSPLTPAGDLRQMLCHFLEHGTRRPRVGAKPPFGVFWRSGGSLCTKGGGILFFDLWSADTLFLQNERGACCLLVCAKAPDLSKLGGTDGRAKKRAAGRDGEQTVYSGLLRREYELRVSAAEAEQALARLGARGNTAASLARAKKAAEAWLGTEFPFLDKWELLEACPQTFRRAYAYYYWLPYSPLGPDKGEVIILGALADGSLVLPQRIWGDLERRRLIREVLDRLPPDEPSEE